MQVVGQHVDTRSGRRASAPQAVAQALKKRIRDGVFPRGTQLPSEPQLASDLGTSRATLREALRLLETDGWVNRKHGVGTFVLTHHPLENSLHLNFGVADLIRSMGMTPGIRQVRWYEDVATTEVARALDVPADTPVMVLERVHTADGDPVVYSVDHLPTALLPAEPPQIILSAFELLHDVCGLTIAFGESTIRPEVLQPQVAEALEVDPGELCLTIDQVDFDDTGLPVLHSVEHHLASAFTFTLLRQRAS